MKFFDKQDKNESFRFMGHTIDFWLDLEKRAQELNVVNILDENLILRKENAKLKIDIDKQNTQIKVYKEYIKQLTIETTKTNIVNDL